MSRISLLILWIIAIVTGIIFVKSKDVPEDITSTTKLDVGSTLIEPDIVESADSMSVTTAGKTVNLKKVDDRWTVAEHDNFPADINRLSRVMNALRDTKIAQGVPVKAKFYDRFELDPSKEGKNSKTESIVLSKGGEEKVNIIFGKERESTGGSSETAGRFVRLSDDDSGVYVTQQSFAFLGSDPDQWITKSFPLLEEGTIKFEVTAPGDPSFKPWSVSRKTVMDNFILDGLTETEETKSNEVFPLKQQFTKLSFTSLLTPEEAKEKAAEKGQRIVKATDSAGSNFEITLTPVKIEETKEDKPDTPTPPAKPTEYIATIKVLNGPTRPEAPAEDASIEEKSRFEARLQNMGDIEKSLAVSRKTYEGRHFLISTAATGTLTKNRQEFIKAKKVKKPKVSVATPPVKVPSSNAQTPPLPGVRPTTPPPGIARPQETPKQVPKKKIKAITEPIRIPPAPQPAKPEDGKIGNGTQTPPPPPGSKPEKVEKQ